MSARHYAWSAIGIFGNTAISFAGNILIARILSPDDYGLIAMLAIFMAIGMNLTESGISDYLINKKDADEKDYATARSHNVTISVAFYIILYFLAPYISDFYGRQELTEIIRLISISIFFQSLSLSEIARLRKKLLFRRLAIIRFMSNISALGAAYYCAIAGFGYWALVVQSLSQAFFLSTMTWVASRKIPSFGFSLSRYREMRGFGNNMLISYLTNQLGDNAASVIIGKTHSAAALGAYTQAKKISNVMFGSINSIVLTTSYPILAKEQNRSIRKKMYSDVLASFLFLHYAAVFLIVSISHEMIFLLLGEKWIDAAFILQLVVISLFFQPLVTVNSNIAKTEGKTHIYRNLTFIRNGLSFLFLVVLFDQSITIIILGQVAARFISAFIDIHACGKLVEFPMLDQLKSVVCNSYAPAISSCVALYAVSWLQEPEEKLIAFMVIYTFLLLAIGFFFRNRSLLLLTRLIRERCI
jgi:teichuronic acid exporter